MKSLPLMLLLAEAVVDDPLLNPSSEAMTKYKTFNGEEINGEKVWHYDFHDDA